MMSPAVWLEFGMREWEPLKVGDAVACWCTSDTWYKGIPGIVVEVGMFSTLVLIKGKIIDLTPSSLELLC